MYKKKAPHGVDVDVMRCREPLQNVIGSFPLNRCWRLARNIIDDAIDVRHLIDDPTGDFLQHFPVDACEVGGHAVDAGDGANGDGVIIRAPIPHDADAADARQHREVLPDILVEAVVFDLFA